VKNHSADFKLLSADRWMARWAFCREPTAC